ncbi:polysaccharide deacetylase family protein [Streptomyces sp. NPDC001156]
MKLPLIESPLSARKVRPLIAGALAVALLSGCAQSVDPIERLGRKAAQKVHRPHRRIDRTFRHWGLTAPLAPAPRPARPRAGSAGRPGAGLPEVLDHVPTDDRVVFLTYDEGVQDDPRFADMVRELRLPVTVFLTDRAVEPGLAHVARLREAGAAIQNQTMDHTPLRGRTYDEQHTEICGQRDRLEARLGLRPRLLHPPYGAYDRTTLRAAADCGITALVLWRPASERHGRGRLVCAGDIVRPHEPSRPLASVTVETSHLLRRIQARGLTVASLEDYV